MKNKTFILLFGTILLLFNVYSFAQDGYFSKPKIVVPDRPSAADRKIIIRDQSNLSQCPNQGPVIVQRCLTGKELVIWDQPIYDDDGLFVICLKKTPYCVPSGLEPQG